MGNDNANGHMMHWVDKGGPADIAGLRNGDKLVMLEGDSVEDIDYLDGVIKIATKCLEIFENKNTSTVKQLPFL